MILKVALLIFMFLHILTFSILIWHVCCVHNEVTEMRIAYKDMLKQEIDQVHSCFEKWQECIDYLNESVRLCDSLLAELKQKEGAQE